MEARGEPGGVVIPAEATGQHQDGVRGDALDSLVDDVRQGHGLRSAHGHGDVPVVQETFGEGERSVFHQFLNDVIEKQLTMRQPLSKDSYYTGRPRTLGTEHSTFEAEASPGTGL